MLISVILFLVGIPLLVKGGDLFVDSATRIAKRFQMSELLIGATVVAVGTTLPEVMVSASSSLQGASAMAYGNAIGSVICNTALVAAITVAVRPAKVNRNLLLLPVLFFFGAAVIYSLFAYFFGAFTRIGGVILIVTFLAYTVISIVFANRICDPVPETPEIEDTRTANASATVYRPIVFELIYLAVGGASIALGADLLVDHGKRIAEEVGIPEAVVALIFISVGTSLPELVTAVTALLKGHGALSVGNVIGANLLNLTLVTGIAALLQPFSLPNERLLFGYSVSLVLDLPVMLLSVLLLILPAMIRNRVSRGQGILLLLLYTAFCAFHFLL